MLCALRYAYRSYKTGCAILTTKHQLEIYHENIFDWSYSRAFRSSCRSANFSALSLCCSSDAASSAWWTSSTRAWLLCQARWWASAAASTWNNNGEYLKRWKTWCVNDILFFLFVRINISFLINQGIKPFLLIIKCNEFYRTAFSSSFLDCSSLLYNSKINQFD